MLFCGAMSENFREDTAKTLFHRLHQIDLCSRLGVPDFGDSLAGKAKDSKEEDADMAATRSTASVGLTRFPPN